MEREEDPDQHAEEAVHVLEGEPRPLGTSPSRRARCRRPRPRSAARTRRPPGRGSRTRGGVAARCVTRRPRGRGGQQRFSRTAVLADEPAGQAARVEPLGPRVAEQERGLGRDVRREAVAAAHRHVRPRHIEEARSGGRSGGAPPAAAQPVRASPPLVASPPRRPAPHRRGEADEAPPRTARSPPAATSPGPGISSARRRRLSALTTPLRSSSDPGRPAKAGGRSRGRRATPRRGGRRGTVVRDEQREVAVVPGGSIASPSVGSTRPRRAGRGERATRRPGEALRDDDASAVVAVHTGELAVGRKAAERPSQLAKRRRTDVSSEGVAPRRAASTPIA